MALQHPDITHTMRTGYPRGVIEPQTIGFDSLGNELLDGDEIYELDEQLFLVEALSFNAMEVLEALGAEKKIAK